MLLTMYDFGGYDAVKVDLANHSQRKSAPNGAGKTTIANAYVFALSGKTLQGFTARRVGASPDRLTDVRLSDFEPLNGVRVRRTLDAQGKTALYLNDEVKTQSDLDELLGGKDVREFAVACADANVLTSQTLTSEQLRKLLIATDLMNVGESAELRRKQKDLRAKRKYAEAYAITNVIVPARKCEPLTDAETFMKGQFEKMNVDMLAGVKCACPTCGHPYSDEAIARRRAVFNEAKTFCEMHNDEYMRILEKKADYDRETTAINDAQRLVDAATQARKDVQRYDAELAEIDAQIRDADTKAVRASLPAGVEIVTERVPKVGTASSACTLTYNGVPLKSVNRGMRIALCVQMLDTARTNKGLQRFPIIVDNAECVDADALVGYDFCIELAVK